ncbi:Surfeit locus protein 1 [Podochytrium sp. JEL0797]|nr:Surfeit locus protein 1 [Podochytrium sp. JEL0797]
MDSYGSFRQQVQRLQWKLALIEDVKQKLEAPAVPFKDFLNGTMAAQADASDDLQFRKIKVKGRFVEGVDLYVGPRTRGAAGESDESRGMSSNPVGFFVYSPFDVDQGELEGSQKVRVLVNRGWISKEARLTEEGQSERKVSGPVEIEAVLRTGENTSKFPTNEPKINQWYSIDTVGMSEWTDSDPILLDMINSPMNAPILTKPHAPLARNAHNIQLKNNHFVYAITWFGMCGITAFLIRGMGRSGGMGGASGFSSVGKGRSHLF